MLEKVNMSKLTIYHNPRCSKSRQTLEILQAKGVTPEIVEYISNPPDIATLLSIAKYLDKPLAELLRRGEDDFKESGSDLDIADDEAVANWLQAHPKVLERPIVVDFAERRAVVGRPPENVLQLLSD